MNFGDITFIIHQSSQQVSSSFSFFDFRGDGVNHGILDPETFIGRFIIFQLEIGVLAQVCFSYLFLYIFTEAFAQVHNFPNYLLVPAQMKN